MSNAHLEIRKATKADLVSLLNLYTELTDHGSPNMMPEVDKRLGTLWASILVDHNHHVVVGSVGGELVSSCVIIIVPNLTHSQRPYALVENVVTRETHRRNGYATALLDYAKGIAVSENCYKIMLLTGSKKETTLKFYEKAGYNSNDKTAFIQWLE